MSPQVDLGMSPTPLRAASLLTVEPSPLPLNIWAGPHVAEVGLAPLSSCPYIPCVLPGMVVNIDPFWGGVRLKKFSSIFRFGIKNTYLFLFYACGCFSCVVYLNTTFMKCLRRPVEGVRALATRVLKAVSCQVDGGN